MSARMAAWVCAFLLGIGSARAQTLEPPPEADDGDYSLEAADSLAEGDLELAYGAAGRVGGASQRSQRVRFRSHGAGGTLRDGNDPLSGGRLEAAAAGGTVRLGRLAPRWGRGLLLGAAADPWSRDATDRGSGAQYRGRSGEGATYARQDGALELLSGQFSRRRLHGIRARHGPAGFGAVGTRGAWQSSAALESEGLAAEVVGDARGRWRAEGAIDHVEDGYALSLRLRGGSSAFRSLAEPKRSGPARAVAVTFTRGGAEQHAVIHGALWAFRPGVTGARGALELARRMGQNALLAAGFEEQHGPRRESAMGASRPVGMRQGLWGEWRGTTDGLTLALRHELWGEHAWMRAAVRRATVVRAEGEGPGGSGWAVSHALWRVRRGESLYLPETDGDRLTLRSLSGIGERTRLELRVPAMQGTARLSLALARGGGRGSPAVWSAEWTRRSRSRPRPAATTRPAARDTTVTESP
ncbi:MAG: hypothetical protein ABIU54_01660 [Candidatus Eisenbacteria bacterium]